jgi:hypothetical protein
LAGDFLVAFDTATNMATLKLNPKDKIDLGTIRMQQALHPQKYSADKSSIFSIYLIFMTSLLRKYYSFFS